MYVYIYKYVYIYIYITTTKKDEKYLWTVIYCYSPVSSCKSGLDGGLNLVFGHIRTKNYSKIKTDLYFAFSSLTLEAFTILYFSCIWLWTIHHFSEYFFLELFELISFLNEHVISFSLNW